MAGEQNVLAQAVLRNDTLRPVNAADSPSWSGLTPEQRAIQQRAALLVQRAESSDDGWRQALTPGAETKYKRPTLTDTDYAQAAEDFGLRYGDPTYNDEGVLEESSFAPTRNLEGSRVYTEAQDTLLRMRIFAESPNGYESIGSELQNELRNIAEGVILEDSLLRDDYNGITDRNAQIALLDERLRDPAIRGDVLSALEGLVKQRLNGEQVVRLRAALVKAETRVRSANERHSEASEELTSINGRLEVYGDTGERSQEARRRLRAAEPQLQVEIDGYRQQLTTFNERIKAFAAQEASGGQTALAKGAEAIAGAIDRATRNAPKNGTITIGDITFPSAAELGIEDPTGKITALQKEALDLVKEISTREQKIGLADKYDQEEKALQQEKERVRGVQKKAAEDRNTAITDRNTAKTDYMNAVTAQKNAEVRRIREYKETVADALRKRNRQKKEQYARALETGNREQLDSDTENVNNAMFRRYRDMRDPLRIHQAAVDFDYDDILGVENIQNRGQSMRMDDAVSRVLLRTINPDTGVVYTTEDVARFRQDNVRWQRVKDTVSGHCLSARADSKKKIKRSHESLLQTRFPGIMDRARLLMAGDKTNIYEGPHTAVRVLKWAGRNRRALLAVGGATLLMNPAALAALASLLGGAGLAAEAATTVASATGLATKTAMAAGGLIVADRAVGRASAH